MPRGEEVESSSFQPGPAAKIFFRLGPPLAVLEREPRHVPSGPRVTLPFWTSRVLGKCVLNKCMYTYLRVYVLGNLV